MSVAPEETGQENASQEVDSTVAPESGTENSQGGGDSINPAWKDVLEIVPEAFHSQVTPHLQKWDKNYQEGINKVHSQYEPYKPYIDGGVTPEQLNYALQVAEAIEQRPQEVIEALQEYYNTVNPQANTQQAQGGANTGEQGQVDQEIPEFLQHPEIQKLQKTVETMANIMVQQNHMTQEQQEDQALSQELDRLHTEKGDFDEEWVLTRAANNPNIPIEKHVDAYNEFVTGLIAQQRRPPGPKVMGAGGNAPDNQVDVKKLDDKGRREMVANLLRDANQNNG